MTARALALSLLLMAGLASDATLLASDPSPRESVDTLIVGGQVYDGSDNPGELVDIAVRDGKIVDMATDLTERIEAQNIIDASGLIVAPGFIDPHTHAGGDLASDNAQRRENRAFAFQGVTTVVIGNDGGGRYQIAEQASTARENGIGTNAAYLVGFGRVREAVLGKADRAPGDSELAEMKVLTRKGMCEGAWGFSTGLYYTPQSYAQTGEVIALAKIAAEYGGYYDTHMRDESTYNVTVTGALAETLAIGREAGLRVHIAHIKALGPAVWGHSKRMIAMVEDARSAGQSVTADQYPWEASGTRISAALVPKLALEGGLAKLRERIADRDALADIRTGMAAAIERRGGADKLLITGQLGQAEIVVGQTLEDLARKKGVSPVDAALGVLETGDARLASFNMNPADIAAFASQPWVVTGSDGSTGHPRKYGSFPKAYRDLVKGDAGMDLSRFIRRSSGMTADIIGLEQRGYLKTGYFADIVIFDPENFAPKATYRSPRELSQGVTHLLVNGTAVIENGEATGALPGRPLLKAAQCP